MIGEELLDVRIKAGRFEKSVPQQNHTIILILSHSRLVDERLPIPDIVHDLNLLWLRGQPTIIADPCYYGSILEYAFIVFDHQKVLRTKRERANDAAKRKSNIGFQSRQIYLLSFLHLQATKLPAVHPRIKPFINKQTFPNTAAAARPFESAECNPITHKAILIKALPKLGHRQQHLHGFAQAICAIIKFKEIPQVLLTDWILYWSIHPYRNQLSILHADVVYQLNILWQIAELDIDIAKEPVELFDTVLESNIDHTTAILFSSLAECEIHTTIDLLIDLPQLNQVKAIIQSVDKSLGIELVIVVCAGHLHAILRAARAGIV